MEYKVESDLWDFQAWSGGKDTLDTLKEKDDTKEVENLIEEMFCGSVPSDTEINDFLWFERDAIAEHLGYKDWEAYEEGWSESDLEDAEDWFEGLTYEEMEAVSGLKLQGCDDDGGSEDFEDAVRDWWDGLDDEKKVEIYYQND